MKRDPRKDPRPGDVLKKGGTIKLVLTEVGHGNDVWLARASRARSSTEWVLTKDFIQWAAKAKVIHVA